MSDDNVSAVVAAFTEEQAERLTGVSERQLRYWDRSKFLAPSFASDDRSASFSRLYSFRDIVCLKVLNALRNESRVPLQHLREVKDRLAHLGDDLWAKTTLYVLNRRVIFINPETQAPEEVVSGQGVLRIPLAVVAGDMHRAIEAMRQRTDNRVCQIERRRAIAGNRPVVSGTRIPVSTIQAFARAGYTVDQILSEYPSLTREDVIAATTYEAAA